MLDFGLSEIVVIGIVALIVFGPERLPEIAEKIGKMLGGFRRGLSEIADEKKDIQSNDPK